VSNTLWADNSSTGSKAPISEFGLARTVIAATYTSMIIEV
jgi:hypothetical protein